MKRLFLFLSVTSLMLLTSCDGASNSTTDSTSTIVKDDSNETDKGVKSKWEYSESIDEMTDKPIYTAFIESENEVQFDFPYHGGSKLTFYIRDNPQYGKDMYIKISSGQFNVDYNGERIKLRFDDDEAFTVNCVSPSDMSMDCLFLKVNFDKILKLLENSETMKINAEFYNEGHRTFTFNVANLKWDH